MECFIFGEKENSKDIREIRKFKKMATNLLEISVIFLLYRLSFISTFPIQLEPNTLVNVVTSGKNWWSNVSKDVDIIQSFFLMNPPADIHKDISQTTTFTIHDVEHLIMGFEMDEDEHEIVGNLTMKNGYFRFARRFSLVKILFILFTDSFNETLKAIQNSGYATSDRVLFLIRVDQLTPDEAVLHKFQNGLFEEEKEAKPFYASIGFFTPDHNQERVAILCYICPGVSEKLQVLEPSSEVTVSSLLSMVNMRHGHQLPVKLTLGPYKTAEPKFLTASSWSDYYGCLKASMLPEFCVLYSVLHFANVSTLKFHIPESEITRSTWLLNFYVGESSLVGIPNVIANSRGVYTSLGEGTWKFIFCIRVGRIHSLDYALRSVFVPELWILIVLVGITLAVFYGNMKRGMDIVWLFTGRGLEIRHPRKIIGYILLTCCMIANIYAAYFKSDSMLSGRFASIKELADDGYKLWVAPETPSFVKRFYGSMPEPIRNGIDAFFGGLDFLSAGEPPTSKTSVERITTMAERNLYLWANDHLDLLYTFGKNPKYVRNAYMCKVMSWEDEYNKISDHITWRTWGYISTNVVTSHSYLLQAGLYARAKNILLFPKQRESKDLDMMDADGFLRWAPMNLKSATGISAMYLAAVETFIFNVWLAQIIATMVAKTRPSCGAGNTRSKTNETAHSQANRVPIFLNAENFAPR